MRRSNADPERTTRPLRQDTADGTCDRSLTGARGPPAKRLQRSVGNQVVQSLVNDGDREGSDQPESAATTRIDAPVQAKLTVSSPGNEAEREAERVADRVMRPSAGYRESDRGTAAPDGIERMCTRCQRRYQQGKPLDCPECEREFGGSDGSPATLASEPLSWDTDASQERLQSTPASRSVGASDSGRPDAGTIEGGLEDRIRSIRSGGRSLPRDVRSEFEGELGHDFGDVRVHTGSEADEVARLIKARAFTVGSDVVFRRGEYAPATTSGKRLLAHELTHVVQQGAAGERVQRQDEDGGGTAGSDAASGSTGSVGVAGGAGSSGSSIVTIEFNAFIPGSLGTWIPEPPFGGYRPPAGGVGYPVGSMPSRKCEVKTDERTFGKDGSSRIHKQGRVTVAPDGFSGADSSHRIGMSHRRCKPSSQEGEWIVQSDRGSPGGSTAARESRCNADFIFVGASSYPLMPASPEINFEVGASVGVERSGNNTGVRVDFSGWHNAFPGYEGIAVVNGTRHVLYRYMPADEGPTPVNLTSSVQIGQKSDGWFDISPVPENCGWNAGAIRSLYSM